ncbi:MAG: GntR family transcriptional regulator [Candidatus Aminicenantes bacterium]|nr:GntR family transcriptional regulator [Candidatus Aminicenantes bacterium]
MFIVVSPVNPDPMYKQVADQIKDAIASGQLKPDEKLPSIREMSTELKISIITIKRAYSDLENENYIYTRPGMGSFVADINREKLRAEKLDEFKQEIKKLLKTGEKFGITADNVVRLVKDIKEKDNG